MILSMTGFGRGSTSTPTRKITVEIKSLNSKQFDISMRMPSCFRELEVQTRNRLAADMERGKVDLTVTMENLGGETSASVNIPLLKTYRDQIDELSDALQISRPVSSDLYALLLRMPDAMKMETQQLNEDDVKAFGTACEAALAEINSFRTQEGRKLYDFFVKKIENIRSLLADIEPYEAERIPKIRARLEDQLARLTSIEYDKGRLEQEMIFYIEKLDVNEEKLRLRSHLDYFMETLGAPAEGYTSGQGKKLGFIAQEMGREINTLGSKSNHAGMQQIVVKMKDELEQIKEQVLNVL